MSPQPSPRERTLSTLLITLLSLVMIASPLLQWWSSSESLWYTPYLLWGVIIGLIAIFNRRTARHVE